MKLFFAAFLLCSLLLSSSFLEPVMASCAEKCNSCANAGIQDGCLKSCGICGEQCKCVSSGTCEKKYECSSETSKCSCCRDKYECSSETSKCSCCREQA